MAEISRKQWNRYITRLRQINDKAVEDVEAYLARNGGFEALNRTDLIDYAYYVSNKYGEASAALSASMYDALAELSGVTVPAAVPAEVTYQDVAKTVNGIIKKTGNGDILAQGIGRLVKMAGTDTILSNAHRDRPKGKGSKRKHTGAQVAWIPYGDTCPFCLMLASKGWVNQTEWGAKSHSEHIHANCDCTYAVRFNNDLAFEGYDPDEYKAMYDNAEGKTRNEKFNSMRRDYYEENKDKINAQKRAAYAKGKANSKNSQSVDITEEYLKKATPKKGSYYKDPLFEDKNGEEKTAQWLHNTFGGDITLLSETNPEGQSNPDYLWNGKLWDLKSPQSLNGINKRLKHGLEQIRSNPGGVAIDIVNTDANLQDIERVIQNRLRVSAKSDVDVIIKNNDELIKVIRYKK